MQLKQLGKDNNFVVIYILQLQHLLLLGVYILERAYFNELGCIHNSICLYKLTLRFWPILFCTKSMN